MPLMENNQDVLKQASEHVQHFLIENQASGYVFHNYEHTEAVVKKAEEIAEKAGLNGEACEDLLLAAWFHDTGFVDGDQGHEERSAELAEEFLAGKQWPENRIKRIQNWIRSTKTEVEPKDTEARILHDADWSFLGRKRFFRRADLLRMEEERLHDKKYSLKEWNQRMLDLQLSTQYKTPWGKDLFGTRKNKNIVKQRKQLVKANKKTIRKRTGKNFGRGIDTLYRITLRNHINLSNIADGKANMIISINTLVLSILITVGTAGMSIEKFSISENLNVIAPVMVLMLTALLAIIFAVFSAMPKVSGVDVNMEKVRNKEVSLLFFGNFLKVEREDFVNYLSSLKTDQSDLYDDLSRDLYNLGQVLKQKYRLLNYSYWAFVGGLVLSFLTFLGFSLFYTPGDLPY